MEFNFDSRKSEANKNKHGIDFVEAQALWGDADRIEIPARTVDEPRSLLIGRIGEKYWSAVIAYRAECIRIISVRRARKKEEAQYPGSEQAEPKDFSEGSRSRSGAFCGAEHCGRQSLRGGQGAMRAERARLLPAHS